MATSPLKGRRDRHQENVGVLYEQVPSTISMDEYMNLSLRRMCSQMGKVKIGKQVDMTIDDVPARRVSFSHSYYGFKMKGGYVVIKGRRAYVIVCLASKKSFDKYRKVFDNIAASFHLE